MLDNWKILQHYSLANMQWDKMELLAIKSVVHSLAIGCEIG